MSTNPSVTTRIPISLRLPASIMCEIEAYAAESNVRKTDAFLYFLQLGIESNRSDREGSRFSAIEERLDEIISLVRCREDVLTRVKSAVLEVAADYPGIRKVYVFGSVARGEVTADSDIDLRLIIDRSKRFNLHDLEHFCKSVESKTNRSVDAVTSQVVKNEALAAAIERDKVLIYER